MDINKHIYLEDILIIRSFRKIVSVGCYVQPMTLSAFGSDHVYNIRHELLSTEQVSTLIKKMAMYPVNNLALITQMHAACLVVGQSCVMEGPVLGKNTDVFSPQQPS